MLKATPDNNRLFFPSQIPRQRYSQLCFRVGERNRKVWIGEEFSVYLYFFPTVAASLLHTGIPKESEEEFNRTQCIRKRCAAIRFQNVSQVANSPEQERGQKKSNTKTTTTIILGNNYCNATDQIPITEKERKITNLSNLVSNKNFAGPIF